MQEIAQMRQMIHKRGFAAWVSKSFSVSPEWSNESCWCRNPDPLRRDRHGNPARGPHGHAFPRQGPVSAV